MYLANFMNKNFVGASRTMNSIKILVLESFKLYNTVSYVYMRVMPYVLTYMCVSFVHAVCLNYGRTTDAGGHIKSTTIHSTLGECY